MNDLVLLGFVFVVSVIALVLIYRDRRRVQQRCPACHRFGRGSHYGRFHCRACGAHFVLDATGRASQTIWDVLHIPIFILGLVAICLLVGVFSDSSYLREHWFGVALLSTCAIWEVHRAFREKVFIQDDKTT